MSDDGPALRPPTEQQLFVGAVCEVCAWNIQLMAGRAGKLVKALRACGGTAGELLEHYGQQDCGAAWWWYRDDWRGKRGQRPDDGSIRATWELWTKPIMVQVGGVADMLAHIQELRSGNRT